MWASLLAFLADLPKAFLTLVNLFKKATAEKVQSAKKTMREKIDKFKKTGRPS